MSVRTTRPDEKRSLRWTTALSRGSLLQLRLSNIKTPLGSADPPELPNSRAMIASKPLSELDCSIRMFLVSLCLSDGDLERFDVLSPADPGCVGRETAARTVLHRLCATEPDLERRVTDLLDLRHVDRVAHVRSRETEDLAEEAARGGREARGEELAGWAWALLTDGRAGVQRLGRCLMGESYVRAMQGLSQEERAPTTGSTRHG